MNGEIHFINGQTLELIDVNIQYTDIGIVTEGENEKVFVPTSSIQFVREFKEYKI